MRKWLHVRAYAASALFAGFLLQAGPCGIQDPELARQVGLTAQQTVVTVFTDTIFFLLDNLFVRLA